MPYKIRTDAADCKGFAVVDEGGSTVGCHTSRKDALNHQRALYANVPDATQKEGPTVSDVHVDSGMGRVRIKKPDRIKKADVETLIKQHDKLHTLTETPNFEQLFVHHNIMDEIIRKGADCDCACGEWSEPLVIENITTDLEKLQKNDNPSLAPVKQIIQSGIDNGYRFADVLHMLDVGGYMMVVRPKIVDEMPTEDTNKSVISRLKGLVKEKKVPDSFVPPQAVREEAKRALAWIKDGHAGANFTDVGRARASQLANGEGVSRETLARMKSFLARHEVDSQGKGYSPGEAGYPSPGRVAYAAWGGSAAKTWVDKLFRQYDLAKSYGEVSTVYKADEKRFTLGPWYIPDQADAHNEWTDSEELQNALWNYVKSGDRRIRLQHNKNVVAGEWVETMTWPYPVTVPVNKADGTTTDVTYPQGTVFMGVQWEPWAWELVKAGKLNGFSIGGKAERVLVDLPEADIKKFNPNHDSRGRFSGGSGGGMITAPATAPRSGMGDIKLDEGTVAEMQGGSAAPHIVKDANGNYMFTPERQALHDKIVNDAVNGVPSSSNPTYVVMGGGPAAGKSSIVRDGGVKLPANTVEINADLAKEKLPEWKTAGKERASFTHEESSYLAKRTQAAAFERKQNVLLDGTGDTSPTSMNKKIDAARNAGYKVEGHYVTLPTDVAIKNAQLRGDKTGRYVPEEFIRSTHAGVSTTFPVIAHRFDKVNLYDTSVQGKPRLIASGGEGILNIHDQAAYDSFIAKGKSK